MKRPAAGKEHRMEDRHQHRHQRQRNDEEGRATEGVPLHAALLVPPPPPAPAGEAVEYHYYEYHDDYEGDDDHNDDDDSTVHEPECLPDEVRTLKKAGSVSSLSTVSTMGETSVSSSHDSLDVWTSTPGAAGGPAADIEQGKLLLPRQQLPSHANKPVDDVVCESLKHESALHDQAFRLCFGAFGIYACYLAYGNLQEDVFRYRAENGTRFKQVWFLQVLECACNVVVGIIGRKVCGGTRPASLMPFFTAGASQVFAKVLTTLSLAAGLSFPVCILAKSAKMIPVMLGQLMLGGSKYTCREYIFATGVVAGVTLLSISKAKAKDNAADTSTATGLVFIVLSLVMDGVTGGLEKKLKHESADGQPPTTYDFLFYMNLSMGLVALTIAVTLGDVTQGILFMAENPAVSHMIFLQCILSAMGQTFIFYVIANFDPMVCATVTTTRKILSVIWSIAVKGHTVNHQGHAGLVLAIASILLGLREKLARKLRQRRRKQLERSSEPEKQKKSIVKVRE